MLTLAVLLRYACDRPGDTLSWGTRAPLSVSPWRILAADCGEPDGSRTTRRKPWASSN